MVHIGTLVAENVMRLPMFDCLLSHLRCFNFKSLPMFLIVLRRQPELRSQLMTSGTSCGMASHFGTPISGILFTLEITPSYYFIRNYWLAALSSVIGGMLARMFLNVFSTEEVSVFAPIFSDIVIPRPSWFAASFVAFSVTVFSLVCCCRLEEVIVLVLALFLSVVCAVLAVMFTHLNSFFFKLKKKYHDVFIYKYPLVLTFAFHPFFMFEFSCYD